MKHSVFLFATLLSVIACTSEDVCMNTEMQTEYEDAISNNEMYRIAKEQSAAYNHYQHIMELMGAQTRNGILDDVVVYPDYYGGAYINDDNKLVMLVKEEFATTRAASNLTSQISDEVIVDECEYSYNELQEVVEEISVKIEQDVSHASTIGMYGIINKTNRVAVSLYDNSEGGISAFKEQIVNSPMIVFYHADNSDEVGQIETYDEPISCTSYSQMSFPYTLNCGERILVRFNDSIGKNASIGYRAKDRLGRPGFVTAGHSFHDSEYGYATHVLHPTNKVLIGSATRENIKVNNGYLDAAFVHCSNSAEITNTLCRYSMTYSDTLSTEIFIPIEGQNIYMKGATTYGATSSYAFGKVLCESAAFTDVINGDTVTYVRDAIFTSYTTKSGDSGGIVFAFNSHNSLYPNQYLATVGINKAYRHRGDTIYSVCVKAGNINSAFGLSRY